MEEYLEEKLARVEKKLDEILKILKAPELKEIENTELLSVNQIAKLFNISKQTLYTTQKYRLPNYGIAKKGCNMRWTLGEVIEWNKKPTKELIEGYKNLPKKEKADDDKKKKEGK